MAQLISADQLTPRGLKEALKFCISNGNNLLIKGMPGTGKTAIVHQVCQELGVDLIVTCPGIEDPTDSKGLPFTFQDPETGKQRAAFMPFGQLEKLLKATKTTVYFMDDLGQAPPSVQAAKMSLINPGYINGTKISPHVVFIGATNRREDKSGVTGMYEALKSRFKSIIELVADALEWSEYALINKTAPIELIAFNRFRPELMKSWKPTNDIVNGPNPRTIEAIGKLQLDGCPPALEYSLFSGAAGQGYATEYLAFLKIYRDLPNPDLVLMSPQTAEIPADPATLYALCGALAARTSEQNFSRLIEYANRLTEKGQGEFSMMLITDILHSKPELKNTKAFIDWSIKNQNLLI